jgi:hypothetical protein
MEIKRDNRALVTLRQKPSLAPLPGAAETVKKDPKSCACERCVSACKKQPGWFAPGEAEKAAEYLKMDFETDFKKFIVKDHCDNPHAGNAPYVWAPRKVGDDGPSEIRTHLEQQLPGVCVFLKDERCLIHLAKPYECRHSFACDWRYGEREVIERKYIEAGAPLGMRPENPEHD